MTKKVNLINFIIWMALLTYLKPANAILWGSVNDLYKIVKVFATIFIIVLTIKNRFKFTAQTVSGLLFLLVWGYSIYRNCGGLGDHLQELLSIIGLMFLFVYIQDKKDKIVYLFGVLSKIAKVYFVLELVTIITNKPLLAENVVEYDRYFLGSDNYSTFIILPLCGCMFAYSYLKKNKIDVNSWLFASIGFLTLAIPFAVTGMVMYGFFLIITMLISYPQIRKLLKTKTAIAIMALFTIGVVLFNVQDHLSGLLSIVGKIGLNSREIIWPRSVDAIRQKPLLGWGALTEAQQNSYLLYGAGHAHNMALEFLLDTGIVGTIIAVIWLGLSLKGIAKVKTYYMYVMQACLFCYLLCSIFDFYLGLIYFWLLIMSFSVLKRYYKLDGLMENEQYKK